MPAFSILSLLRVRRCGVLWDKLSSQKRKALWTVVHMVSLLNPHHLFATIMFFLVHQPSRRLLLFIVGSLGVYKLSNTLFGQSSAGAIPPSRMHLLAALADAGALLTMIFGIALLARIILLWLDKRRNARRLSGESERPSIFKTDLVFRVLVYMIYLALGLMVFCRAIQVNLADGHLTPDQDALVADGLIGSGAAIGGLGILALTRILFLWWKNREEVRRLALQYKKPKHPFSPLPVQPVQRHKKAENQPLFWRRP